VVHKITQLINNGFHNEHGEMMSSKAELKKALEILIGDADEQTQMHLRSQQKLYQTLGGAYLWWREAKKLDGFLDALYDDRQLVHRGKEENFTRLVRLVWQLDWSGMYPKLQNWAKALRGLDHEFKTNRNAYEVQKPIEKIEQFFNAKGGVRGVGDIVSPLQETDEEVAIAKKKAPTKKSELDILNQQQIRQKHIQLGELHFSDEPPYIKNIVTKNKKINVTRKGYAVALVKRTASGGLDILSLTNNDSIVHDTIVETYKRNDDALPTILRTLSETIKTQTLPIQLEKHRQGLNDLTDVLGSDGKTKLRTVKRLLLRPKTKDFLLSECRTDCSVVTLVKPNKFPSNVTEDITLRAVNHKYIEQNMLQTRDLCFYTTETRQLEAVTDESLKASHRLRTKNTVTDRIHNLYFYKLSSQSDGSKPQAEINHDALGTPTWLATVNKEWLEDLNSVCSSNWLREFGSQWNRDRHKQVMLKLSKSFEISYDGTRGHYTKTETHIPKPKVDRHSKALQFHVRSKDIFTVFNSLSEQDIQGDIELAANEHVFTISFKTSHASYLIAVPTCNDRGHLDRTAFKASEA
jgi:hypothetical protein